MEKYICIHGHFYQPPRENPWLEEIEVQESAYPFRDWNERITAECYSPNTAARILAGSRTIEDILNNYSKISFNFGPTLLSWMEFREPETYRSILEADKISQQNFSGHGSAIAQVYNHIIMPLSNKRDKTTQVIWGIEDFKFRFGRDPEGMWLAETAVDIETLETLAENGIKFTILAPRQAARIRKIGDENWMNVFNGSVDPKKAYLCNLPSGRKINLFFYDGPISQELGFGDLLTNGENLANRLAGTFTDEDFPQLAHIATDGETYGHHKKHGDMALAYCLNFIEKYDTAKLTIYGEFLEKHPPEYEAEIIENTSWSCIHGVERWRNNCGCNTGREGWTQEWRAPLRFALDWLRDEIIPLYVKEIKKFGVDPWELRNKYIHIILNRDPQAIDKIFKAVGIKEISKEEMSKLVQLLELQRHALLMYTSCGWFFDEISGLETVQVLKYAARAIQLSKKVFDIDLEKEFIERLKDIPSNIPEVGTGDKVYENYVKPSIIDNLRVAAHYAISSLFFDYDDETMIYSYEITNKFYTKKEAGKRKLVVGKILMKSRITLDEEDVCFAFIHLGDQNVTGGVSHCISAESFDTMLKELEEEWDKINITGIILLLDKYYGKHSYTMQHLFKDEKRKVFKKLMEPTLADIDYSFERIYSNHYPIMIAMSEMDTPFPGAIKRVVDSVINKKIRSILKRKDGVDLNEFNRLTEEVNKWNVILDKTTIAFVASRRINFLMNRFKDNPSDLELLDEIKTTLEIINKLKLDLDVWQAQNNLFYISKKYSPSYLKRAEEKETEAIKWLESMEILEQNLNIRIL